MSRRSEPESKARAATTSDWEAAPATVALVAAATEANGAGMRVRCNRAFSRRCSSTERHALQAGASAYGYGRIQTDESAARSSRAPQETHHSTVHCAMKFCQDFNFPNRRQECRHQSRCALPRSARAESMIITNTVWRIAGISGLFTMSILASDLPSSDTTDNGQAGIARDTSEDSLKLKAVSLIDEEPEKSEPPQAASGLSPAPKKRNEEKPQPNLENDVVSEPFAEPTPISQTMSSSLIDEESEKSEHSQPASR